MIRLPIFLVAGSDSRSMLRRRMLVLVFLSVLTAGFLADRAMAQERFSPDDPAVQKMAERAVAALDKGGHTTSGHLVLGALAIVESTKRYEQRIPKEVKTVKAAIAKVLADMPTNSAQDDGPLANAEEVYYPAVALILLAEVDDNLYADQVKTLVTLIGRRQTPSGGFTYNKEPQRGDTSQIQYAALALFVARQHRFFVEPGVAKAALTWLTRTQQPGGTFVYHMVGTDNQGYGRPRGGNKTTPSIQAAGVGTVYLLADLLQLNARKKSMSKELSSDALILPPGVSIYVKPKDDAEKDLDKPGPLANFDRTELGSCQRAGNELMEEMFAVPVKTWNYYYLYAFERYAYFREQAEGDVGKGSMRTWYDDAVEHLAGQQAKDGSFPKGNNSLATSYVNTALAVLFLVRSSEILVQPSADTVLKGGLGFDADTEIRASGGRIRSNDAQQSLESMMSMMSSGDLDDSDLEDLAASMKRAIQEFRSKDDSSRGNVEAFLRTMIANRNYFRRLIAVRFLAGEQDLDNVPALLYALSDPDFRIAFEAHNGLRLISRKIDSISLSREAVPPVSKDEEVRELVRLEYKRVKDRWTEWFLKLRPDAKLLD